MKFGMPTLVECTDIFECAEVAERYGLDFIEINMSFPQYQTDSLSVENLSKLAKEKGIFYTIHADEQLNPFDFNKTVSECYFRIFADYIDFAKALSIPTINIHLLKGVYVTLPDKVVLLSDVYRDEYIARVKEFIKMCEEKIGDAPIKIAIENVDSNPFTVAQTVALEYFMKSPVFALTLDVGHDDCMNGADRHVFEKYPDKLVHMHLHDSDGKHAHLPFGEGRVDIFEKLDMLDDNSNCLVEVKTVKGLEDSMKFLRERGRI